jgi:tRNA (uracil-5-)-methyltransferase TRM9
VDSDIARRLTDLNRAFYQTFAASFAATRGRVQPGARRLLARAAPDSAVLDLGCGNGNAARWLESHGHRGSYLGLDFSPELLAIARAGKYSFPAVFRTADFLGQEWHRAIPEASSGFLLAFAVLHHIPSEPGRVSFLSACQRLLAPNGQLFLSNWQFLRSEKLRARIVPWSGIGLKDSDVDAGDYLVDWRRDGRGPRYVHVIGAEERLRLAARAGFTETEFFESDGEGGRLSDYAVWVSLPSLPHLLYGREWEEAIHFHA